MDQNFLNSGIGFIAQVQEERAGQILREGFTTDHDDEYTQGEIAQAAACYAMPPEKRAGWPNLLVNFWPWLVQWWEPVAIPSRQRELIKAAALLYAEWHRLERVILKDKGIKVEHTDNVPQDEREIWDKHIDSLPADTLAAAAITELEDITDFEKAIREAAEKNITDELAKHQQTIHYVQKCPACNGAGYVADNAATEQRQLHLSWDYNQHKPEILTARCWYDEYNRLHVAFDQPFPKPDDPERFT